MTINYYSPQKALDRLYKEGLTMTSKQYDLKKFTLPGWTKRLPEHANLSTKDIAEIFGVKAGSVLCMVGLGYIPESDSKQNGIKAYKHFWYLKLLRSPESKG